MMKKEYDKTLNNLTESTKTLWLLFHFLEDHSTHKFWYSLETLVDITGLSKPTLIKDIKELEAKNLISCEKKSGRKTVYTLLQKANFFPINSQSNNLTSKENEPVNNHNQLRFLTTTSKESLPLPVKNLNPTSKESLPDPILYPKEDPKNKSLSPVHGSNIVHADDEIEKKERENSLSLPEEDRMKKDRVMRIIEDEFPFYFDKALKYTQRTKAMTEMMVEIGNYDDRTIQHEVHEVCKGLQQPVNLIKFVHSNLKNNGHKPIEDTWESKVAKKRIELKNKLEHCSDQNEFLVTLRDRAFLDESRILDLWDGYEKERLKLNIDYSFDDFMELFNRAKKNITIDDIVN